MLTCVHPCMYVYGVCIFVSVCVVVCMCVCVCTCVCTHVEVRGQPRVSSQLLSIFPLCKRSLTELIVYRLAGR